MLLRLFSLGVALFLAAATALAERIIAEGDDWRYYKGMSTPPLQSGTINWTQIAYNDSTWGGPSPSGFGYGDGDDATVFGDMQNSYASVYIRKTFVIADPESVTRLTLAVDYDDGFVAYLNGTEIAQRNMPSGTIIHSTSASGNHEASRGEGVANPQEKEFIEINPALLVSGTNVVALSGHNVSLSSSDFSLIPELYTNVTLTRGPYIQMPQDSAVTVVWRTDALTNSVVEYGSDSSYNGGTVTDATATREHVVHIPGLQSGQSHHYRISSGGVALATGVFYTKRDSTQPWRAAIWGDFGWSNPETAQVAAAVTAVDPQLLLTVGDNIYNDGQPGDYDRFWFTPYNTVMRRAAMMPALGNHDVIAANGQWHLNYFYLPENGPTSPTGLIERNYSFDYGNAHFAVVDSNPFSQNNSAQMNAIRDWLDADLAATQQPWKFVLLHHPPYTSAGSGHHGDQANVKALISPVCEQRGVQILFQGHNHFYERINAINGVYYITTGAGGRELRNSPPPVRKIYSAAVNSSQFSFTQLDVNGARLQMKQISKDDAVLDQFDLDLAHPFKIDGLLDSNEWLRAGVSGTLRLHAAIRKNVLYVATQDAGEGSDHFIYLASGTSSMRTANWAKSGQVMQWSAFLSDENDNAFVSWFGPNEEILGNVEVYRSMTSGLNNNDPGGNGVLEGTIDLAAHVGSFPQQIYLAAAPFATASGGVLVASAQVPTGNSNGDIEANEFLILNTRDIALDLPVSAAGPGSTVEAGMAAQLNGSASSSPSDLPLSYEWTQLSGPAGSIANGNQQVATFAAASNVTENTNTTFQLRVNDGRFDVDDTVTIQLYPMVDSDGDGLSDQEELTGYDNVLTAANPAGRISNPNIADSDGDGMNDGAEALAGTDPNDGASVFEVISIERDANGNVHVSWSSIVEKVYRVQFAGTLPGQWQDLSEEITATTSTTSYLHTTAPQSGGFYRVRVVR